MWAKTAGRTLAALDGAPSENDAFEILHGYARVLGAELLSYHFIQPRVAGPAGTQVVRAVGFPDDWVAQYTERAYFEIDPITAYASYQTRPVRWSAVPERVTLTGEQQAFIAALRLWLDPGDGLAIPAFGPSGRHGYVGIGSRKPLERWGPAQMRTVQAVCEAFHLRVCELRLAGLPKDFDLDARERIILSGMSRGWTDPMIGASVNLRPEQLGSAIGRILAKMSVQDRPSAVLRAEALGLVEG